MLFFPRYKYYIIRSSRKYNFFQLFVFLKVTGNLEGKYLFSISVGKKKVKIFIGNFHRLSFHFFFLTVPNTGTTAKTRFQAGLGERAYRAAVRHCCCSPRHSTGWGSHMTTFTALAARKLSRYNFLCLSAIHFRLQIP